MTSISLALLLTFLVPSTPVPQFVPGARADSSEVVVRRPPAAVLEGYVADSDYQYVNRQGRQNSWWDRFWEEVFRRFNDLFDETGQQSYWRYLIYGAAMLMLVIALLRMLKMDAGRLFRASGARPGGVYEGVVETFHENDFFAWAEEAVLRGDYREGTRMYYMHVLRVLDERGHIHWMPRKTNGDYLRECRGAAFRPALARLTYLFDYSWYGHFPVDKSTVDEMRTLARGIEKRRGAGP